MLHPADAAFFEQHRAGGGVILTWVLLPDGSDRNQIFSSIDKAEAWVGTLPDGTQAVHAPKLIDEPDFGNVKAS